MHHGALKQRLRVDFSYKQRKQRRALMRKKNLYKLRPMKVNPARIEMICLFLDDPDNRFLNLRSDQAFKGVIGDNTDLAARLMNEFLPLEQGAEVVKADLMDPHLGAAGVKDSKADKSDVRDRGYILDLLYRILIYRIDKDELHSVLVDLEMQSKDLENLMKRWVVYGGRLYSGQSSKGQPIGRENPVFIIVFLEKALAFFKKFGDIKKHEFYSVLRITDSSHPGVVFPDLTWVFIELGKFNISLDEIRCVRECLAYTIKHSETLRRKDVLTLIEKGGCIVAELIDAIYTKSKDRDFVESLRRFRLMDRDDDILVQEGEKRGMQKGLLKGEKRGMQKGLRKGKEAAKREIAKTKREIAKALLTRGLAQDFVAQSTGLSPQDTAKLAEEVESSST